MLTFRYNGQSVTCRVNDRGGAIVGDHFDLSRHAAETLGIIQAGRVSASFAIGNSPGASAGANAAGANSSSAGPGGGIGGGVDLLTVLEDIATLNISDLAVQMALAGVTVVKDVTLGIADFIVIPFWQWNQRAVAYFVSNDLFSKNPDDWTITPWTAAFWGLGYWLLWTEPDSGSLKPVPVRRARLARHTRGLQSIPARRSLVKPADVSEHTPKKPKPAISTSKVVTTGTMKADRAQPVKVTGNHGSVKPAESSTRVKTEGTTRPPSPIPARSTPPEPHAKHRTGNGSLRHSGRSSTRTPKQSPRSRGNA
jgi:hypothetical protein